MTCLVKYFKWLWKAKVNYFLHQTTKCTKYTLQAHQGVLSPHLQKCMFIENNDRKDLSVVYFFCCRMEYSKKSFHELRQFTSCALKPFDGYRHPM